MYSNFNSKVVGAHKIDEKANSAPIWTEMDKPLLAFQTWEEYLDSLIEPRDLRYLDTLEYARAIVGLGIRSHDRVIDEKEFYRRRARIEDAERRIIHRKERDLELYSLGYDQRPIDDFVEALATRELANKQGLINTIIFIRYQTKRGTEISGYIDYGHRLSLQTETENWKKFFHRKQMLVPRENDLGFYHWRNYVVASNLTNNYVVLLIAKGAAQHGNPFLQFGLSDSATRLLLPLHSKEKGLLFQNRHDHKTVCPHPSHSPGEGSHRTRIMSDRYMQIEIYDHEVRKRT